MYRPISLSDQSINQSIIVTMYPCWTFAVTVIAWHSSCHTSQPVLFRWQPTTGSLQSLRLLKERNKPSVRWKSFAIHKLVWWHFQVGWASGLQFVFFWDNANNQNVWIILLKMTFWISQFQRLHLRSEVDKSVRFHVKFSQDLTCQKSLKSVNFWQSISTCICNYHAIYARMP